MLKPKCKVPWCYNKKRSRGLCGGHSHMLDSYVRNGRLTEDDIERATLQGRLDPKLYEKRKGGRGDRQSLFILWVKGQIDQEWKSQDPV